MSGQKETIYLNPLVPYEETMAMVIRWMEIVEVHVESTDEAVSEMRETR